MSDLDPFAPPDRLYALLPLVIRRRDEQEGSPLRALLQVIETETVHAEAQIARLYRNWFIETCDDWVVPYLADLVAYRLPTGTRTASGRSPRREVAKALSYRRRSGTASLLVELAWDITGWPARLVECGNLICFTTRSGRPRPASATTLIRNRSELKKMNGPFDSTPRLASIAPTHDQWYRRDSVALYVWRTAVRRVTCGEAAPHEDDRTRFTVDPFGLQTTLYLRPDPHPSSPQSTGTDPTIGVPNPIGRHHLREPLSDGTFGASPGVYGPDASLAIYTMDWPGSRVLKLVPADQIEYAELKQWRQTTARKVLVDPHRGRVQFPEKTAMVRVTYHHTAPPRIGAGRSGEVGTALVATTGSDGQTVRRISRFNGPVSSLDDAISQPRDRAVPVIFEIADSGLYEIGPATIDPYYKTLPGGRLEIRAVDESRPAIGTGIESSRVWKLHCEAASEIVLDGLLIGMPVEFTGEGSVTIRNCTLWDPGQQKALILDRSVRSVRIENSIIGSISCAGHASDPTVIWINDSVVSEIDAGTTVKLTIRCSTVFGATQVRHLELAENCIFMDRIWVRHRQSGGMRYSFVAAKSLTPRRFECQPDKSGAEPAFISRTFGDSGFAVLADDCPTGITEGADDDAEMGALHGSFDFRRLADLVDAATDYLPAEFDLRVLPVSPGSTLEHRS